MISLGIGFIIGLVVAGYVVHVIMHLLHGAGMWVSIRGPFHTRIGKRL